MIMQLCFTAEYKHFIYWLYFLFSYNFFVLPKGNNCLLFASFSVFLSLIETHQTIQQQGQSPSGHSHGPQRQPSRSLEPSCSSLPVDSLPSCQLGSSLHRHYEGSLYLIWDGCLFPRSHVLIFLGLHPHVGRMQPEDFWERPRGWYIFWDFSAQKYVYSTLILNSLAGRVDIIYFWCYPGSFGHLSLDKCPTSWVSLFQGKI